MHYNFFFFLFFLLTAAPVQALQVKHYFKTSIGVFDACEETLEYSFYRSKDYDVKTSLITTGTFGTLYPFKAQYHAVGTYEKDVFRPQDYFYEAHSRFRHRTKEIVYQNGVPQYRVSTKNDKKRRDAIVVDEAYPSSNDLLSTFAALIEQIQRKDNCDFEKYSFNGKRYALSKVKTLGREKIETAFFKGKALKCRYNMEVLDDADAGFLVDRNEPIIFWVLKDEKTKVPFLAMAVMESTPFGKMETVATKIEVVK